MSSKEIDDKIKRFTDKIEPSAMNFPKLRHDIKELFRNLIWQKLDTIPDETWDQFKKRSGLLELFEDLNDE